MRKILIGSLALSLIFTSCDKEDLQLYPYDAVSENIVLETPTDFENVVLGSYSYMIKNLGAGETERIDITIRY